MTTKKFVAKLTKAEGEGTGFFLVIPFDVKEAFGKARPPVVCTLNGKTSWRTTVAVYGGKSFIGVRAEIREQAGVVDGSKIEVTLTADDAPRVVETPADLKKALKGSSKKAWEKMSFTHQKEWVKALDDAKKPGTRARRLGQLLEKLAEK
jgi:hypothetical protein